MRVYWKAQELGAGVWGVWCSPRVRGGLDCREMDQEDEKEETVVGNACREKSSSHGSKAILLSHA